MNSRRTELSEAAQQIVRSTLSRFVAMRRYQGQTAIHFSGEMVRACEELLKLTPELAKERPGLEVCAHCGRQRPDVISDPHCAAANDRSPWVYCEWVAR